MYTDEEICDLIFDLGLIGLGEGQNGDGKFPHIRINTIEPERKDRERAYMLGVLPGNQKADGPLQGKANSQAKAITNSLKLVRRSIAVVERWGTGDHQTSRGISNPWKPFRERLIRNGFSSRQILEIESKGRRS